jgi:hypothetical protein
MGRVLQLLYPNEPSLQYQGRRRGGSNGAENLASPKGTDKPFCKGSAVMGLSLQYRPVIKAKSNNCCKVKETVTLLRNYWLFLII